MIGFVFSLLLAGVAIGVMLMAVVQRHAKQRARIELIGASRAWLAYAPKKKPSSVAQAARETREQK
jgi:hypothetical protein